ncbi:MAG TPA: hypothetical protein VKD72_28810 [Gemmataceae bacterium]|nr:hypothetical protein [Gemmataceae bacterium]
MTDWSFSEQVAYENEREMVDQIVANEPVRYTIPAEAIIAAAEGEDTFPEAWTRGEAPTPVVVGMPVTWKRLRSGGWGIIGPACLIHEGGRVNVVKKDGTGQRKTVRRILWQGTDREGFAIAIATVGRA